MNNRRYVLRVAVLGIIVLAVGGAFFTAYTADDSPVKVGEPAPDFVLENLEGEKVRLSDYKGKGVFINFWASNCPPCREEMPYMENQYQQFKDKGIEILAVNIAESHLTASRFAERYGLSFPILLDQDRSVTHRYGVLPIPSSFFVDENGIVVDKVEGMMTEEMIRAKLELIVPQGE
ncbi:thiol-disulfide oxidoreductase ResA [Caldalkalibacillus thermarum]|uniref:thiol-disulfide oxidoreductase ResA n=1 Tax=Caldalkalibacillus thermarum TaxID=296745 RepID=UPI001667329F|nr:thiol-disulfide oxidoreductase ResA [Caldalkalibacillus thermarum]GGK15368.1 thiol-disulfide oxidoreductase ResA [Caldalkalibacillus thermarum]